MKKIMLVGDSIRMGFQNKLIEKMQDKAEVVAPKDNCRFAYYTLWNFCDWLTETGGNPDIIFWNNGKWDVCERNGLDGVFCTKEDYVKTMLRALKMMQKTGAKVIFYTTIPYHRDYKDQGRIERVEEYNEAVVPVLRENGAEIFDLHKVVLENDPSELICEDLLHLNDKGADLCATHIAKYLETFLN